MAGCLLLGLGMVSQAGVLPEPHRKMEGICEGRATLNGSTNQMVNIKYLWPLQYWKQGRQEMIKGSSKSHPGTPE